VFGSVLQGCMVLVIANVLLVGLMLADRIGVTRQTVLAIEAAKYSPSLQLAFKIALVFSVPFDLVFQYDTAIEKGNKSH
jgi:DNA-binding XRE family transcriptional regulator